jgi:hypothetical protein
MPQPFLAEENDSGFLESSGAVELQSKFFFKKIFVEAFFLQGYEKYQRSGNF